MDGHLISVEVGVERRTHERMKLNGLTFDEDRLERLNTKTVQGRSTVQHDGMFLDDFFKDVPHLGPTTFNHALGRLDVLRQLLIDEAFHHERLEQLKGHQLRQTALVQLEGRANDDDGTAGIVNALTKKVLAEAALLAFEHVRQRLEGTVARPGHRTTTTTVVEQCVHGLLQHALFVIHDDLGGAKIEETLETVVAIDDAAVQIVEVRSGEAAAVELDHRAKVGRDDGHGAEDHGSRII